MYRESKRRRVNTLHKPCAWPIRIMYFIFCFGPFHIFKHLCIDVGRKKNGTKKALAWRCQSVTIWKHLHVCVCVFTVMRLQMVLLFQPFHFSSSLISFGVFFVSSFFLLFSFLQGANDRCHFECADIGENSKWQWDLYRDSIRWPKSSKLIDWLMSVCVKLWLDLIFHFNKYYLVNWIFIATPCIVHWFTLWLNFSWFFWLIALNQNRHTNHCEEGFKYTHLHHCLPFLAVLCRH